MAETKKNKLHAFLERFGLKKSTTSNQEVVYKFVESANSSASSDKISCFAGMKPWVLQSWECEVQKDTLNTAHYSISMNFKSFQKKNDRRATKKLHEPKNS